MIPASGRSPAEGNGSPLQYACLEHPVDREKPGGLQSRGSQRVGRDGGTRRSTQRSVGGISAFTISQVDQRMGLPGRVKA